MPKRKISAVDESLGHNLTYYRRLVGLTQQQVAEKLNLNRTTYTKYETGASEPGIEMLKHLAGVLHVEVGMLLSEDVATDAADRKELLQGDEDWIAFRRRYEALSEGDREKVRALLNELYSKRSARMKREN